MIKKILSGLFLSLLISGTAMAEVVVVNGSGASRDAAINDAKRNAVEKVVGSYVSATTVVDSPYVLKDEIYAKAYGFVKDVQILQETPGTIYRVQARVNVDNSPNSQLMNKLETLRVLNNPRISVVVNHNTTDEKSVKYINLCEAIITQKLQEMGFTKIVDKARVWQRKNEGRGEIVISKGGVVKNGSGAASQSAKIGVTAASSGSGYSNKSPAKPGKPDKPEKPPIPKPGPIDYEAYLPNSDTDYFIFGSLEFNTSKVTHFVYKELREAKSSNFDTGFLKTTATLEIKLLKSDTMEQVGIHSLTASSLHSDSNTAEREAVEKVAIQAANKISETFKKKSASIDSGFELQARMDQSNLDKFMNEVRKTAGVRNIRLRNYDGGKAYFEVDSDAKPFDLFRQLQQNSRFRITRVAISDNLLEIMVV